MQPPILSLENISYQYRDGTVALKNITWNIELGKKIALLGNNGAGKSTLFLLLNAIVKATDGVIRFKGEPLSYKRQEIQNLRQQIGIVFQNPDTQLFSPSVYEDIKYGPKNMGLSPDKVEETVKQAMMLTETESLKDKPPHFLSIGQKKRVAIAGILAMNPVLMVLDEPTSGLDPYYAKRMMQLLDEVHSQERSILLSTHDVNLAYEWADEVVILHEGRIVSHGDPCNAFQDEEINRLSHLEKPWILEVFEQLHEKFDQTVGHYPKSKEELFNLLNKL